MGIRLLDAPSDRKDDPRARTYIVDHLAPGASIKRGVEISNGTSKAVRVKVYAGPAELKDGAFQPLEEGKMNDLTTWTQVSPGELDLAPGKSARAEVSIAVPSNAPPGEQYGAVWAQLSSPPGVGGVTQVNRVGVRIYLSVGPGGEPASDYAIDSLTAQRTADGIPVVTAQVRNTGGRALDLTGELKLTDGPGGLSGGPFAARLGTTLGKGQTAPVLIELDKQLPAGPWQATLTLKSGILERSGSAQITFPDAGTAPAVPAETTGTNSNGSPLIIGGIMALLVLAIVIFLVMSRKRRSSLAG